MIGEGRSRPTKSIASRTRFSTSVADRLTFLRAESDILGDGLLKELVLGVWNTRPTAKRVLGRTCPLRPRSSDRTAGLRPRWGFKRPLKCWMRVDLPEPVCPMTPRISPFFHLNTDMIERGALKGSTCAVNLGQAPRF